MKAHDKNGKELYVSVWGQYDDDIQIEEIYYVDDPETEVSESVIDYIYDNYDAEIYEAWLDSRIGASHYYYND